MVRISMGEPDRLCASCKPGITKMQRLPYLNDVWQYPVCSSFEYQTADYWIEEEDNEFGEE